MRLVPIALLAAFVITGCGEGSTQSQNVADNTQLSAQNRPHVLKAKFEGTEQPILGVSTNSYGVWDDVEQYIASRFKDPAKAKAMRQLALAMQNGLLQNDTLEKGQAASRDLFRAIACLDQTLGEAWYYESKLFTAEMLNSEARSRAYAIFDSNSGGIYKDEKGEPCDN